MKITISVNGRFHAFDLAAQLHKHGHLHRLITTYPTWKATEWGIPKEKVISLVPLEVLKRATNRLSVPSLQKSVIPKQKQLFDWLVAQFIPTDSDIFIGWSSNSLFSIRKAKAHGIITVLERGSAHKLTQLQLLREEYALCGFTYNEPNVESTRRELMEYKVCDYISIPSSFVSRSFIRHGVSPNKLFQIPYGVDLEQFKKIEKTDEVFRVVFAGNLSLQKGSHYLLKAVHELDLPGFEFWHMGGIASEMRPYIEKYRSNKTIFHGHKPQKELYLYYSQGSAFCMPSVQEGLAMVQVQALACGLPLICTTNTGGEDLITDGIEGFVIPIRDVEAIKEKIVYLYEHPDICKAMGSAAQQKVQSGLSWDDYGRHMIKEYERILG